MMSATVEIILLLLAAGVAGGLAGAGIGHVLGSAARRRRTSDHLRRRLIEAQRAVVLLERTASAGKQQDAETGTRLSQRVAAARQERTTPEAEHVVGR